MSTVVVEHSVVPPQLRDAYTKYSYPSKRRRWSGIMTFTSSTDKGEKYQHDTIDGFLIPKKGGKSIRDVLG